MTNEQIKQNAEAYASYFYPRNSTVWQDRYNAYITGAHSRDEEIESIYNNFKEEFNVLEKQLNQLRNPWISVEDELPKKTRELELLEDEHDKVVIVCRRFGEVVTAYLDAEEIWRLYPTGRPFYSAITHWMPIPELPKGE